MRFNSFRWTFLLLITSFFCSCWAGRASSQVVAWGQGGVTNVPPDLTNVVSVVTASDFGLALRSDGTISAWGDSFSLPAGLTNVVALSAGSPFTCMALGNNGTVAVWGSGSQTNVPPGLTNIVAIAAGEIHCLVLNSNGSLVAWGSDVHGQTNIPPGLTNVVAISAGEYHSIALRPDGKVVVWGAIVPAITNVPADLTNAVAIAGSVSASTSHSLALRADGTVSSWGYGQAPVPTGLSNVIAIAAGEHLDAALKADGTIAVWGLTNVPSGLTNVSQVACGPNEGLVLIGDGPPYLTSTFMNRSIGYGMTTWFYVSATGTWPLSYQWRHNDTNLLGATNVILALTNVIFAQGGTYSVAVSNADGVAVSPEMTLDVLPTLIAVPPISQVALQGTTVTFSPEFSGQPPVSYQWQYNGTNIVGATNASLTLTDVQWYQYGQYSVVVSNSLGVVQSSPATLSVNQVAAWGDNTWGQTSLPLNLTNIIGIAAGSYHDLFLKSDGTVVAIGLNDHGQTNVPSDLTNVVAVAGNSYSSLSLKNDGTVVAWGYDADGETNVPVGLSNVVAIAGGATHSLALRSDGTVVAWGYNSNLIGEYTGQSTVPDGLSNVVAIAAGGFHSLALKSDGTIAAWGDDLYGQTDLAPGLTNVTAIAAGEFHSLALLADGTLEVSGYFESSEYSGYVQAFTPPLSNVVAVAAGASHDMALLTDGTVVAWGCNNYGETNLPPGLTNVVAVGAGYFHNLVLGGTGRPADDITLLAPSKHSAGFSFSLQTQSGKVYQLQHKNSLSDQNWIALPLTAGNGGILTLTDDSATNVSRFYRVQGW